MSLEQFNAHQQDVSARTDSLAKAIFVLSGGALSISIGIFSNLDKIPKYTASVLKLSWWSLTITIWEKGTLPFNWRVHCFSKV